MNAEICARRVYVLGNHKGQLTWEAPQTKPTRLTIWDVIPNRLSDISEREGWALVTSNLIWTSIPAIHFDEWWGVCRLCAVMLSLICCVSQKPAGLHQ